MNKKILLFGLPILALAVISAVVILTITLQVDVTVTEPLSLSYEGFAIPLDLGGTFGLDAGSLNAGESKTFDGLVVHNAANVEEYAKLHITPTEITQEGLELTINGIPIVLTTDTETVVPITINVGDYLVPIVLKVGGGMGEGNISVTAGLVLERVNSLD